MNDQFIQDRITACQDQIVALDGAILGLSSGKIKSYALNTGQTTETVSKKDILRLQEAKQDIINECTMWEVRLNGGSILVQPGW